MKSRDSIASHVAQLRLSKLYFHMGGSGFASISYYLLEVCITGDIDGVNHCNIASFKLTFPVAKYLTC